MDADQGRDERRLVVGALVAAAALVPPVAGGAWYLAGPAAALSALIGLGFVLLLFGLSAAVLAWSARRSRTVPLGLLVGAALGRLLVYAAALAGLSRLDWVHRPSLAVATLVAVTVTLGIELRLLQSMPRLFWVDAEVAPDPPAASRPNQPAASRPTAVPTANRSRSL